MISREDFAAAAGALAVYAACFPRKSPHNAKV